MVCLPALSTKPPAARPVRSENLRDRDRVDPPCRGVVFSDHVHGAWRPFVNGGLARHCGLTRARVTQLLKVLDLPPSVVTYLSELPEPEQAMYAERRPRPVTDLRDSGSRLHAFERLREAVEGV